MKQGTGHHRGAEGRQEEDQVQERAIGPLRSYTGKGEAWVSEIIAGLA